MLPRLLSTLGAVGGLSLLLTQPVHADLFDDARKTVRTDLGYYDTTGITLRGGAGLTTGFSPGSTTLLRGHASVGGPCGAFDLASSLTQAFEELPDLFEALIGQVLTSIPMLALCYASPTLCDLAKHWQALVNLAIQAQYGQCQQIQMAMAYGGLRLRGGQISQCLEEQVQAGNSISVAMHTCNSDVQSIRTPSGGKSTEVALVQETLTAAGANQETKQLARALLGEVTLRANGRSLDTDQHRPQGAMLRRYETHRTEADAMLRQAVEELRTTRRVSDTRLQALSVPGQPIPRAALEALVTLQSEPVRYESLAQKLTTSLAITKLTWECTELQEQLAASIEANHELTDEARRMLEKRLEGLQRELQQVMARKEVVERHLQPAIEALLHEYAAVQEVATQAGLRAPSRGRGTAPHGSQLPAGYTQ
jgi:hypothetical protein